MQSATGQTTTGNATLNSSNYNSITWNCGDGYNYTDVLKWSGSTWVLLASTDAGSNASAYVLNDTGQSTTAYTLPTRNTTGDVSVGGNAAVIGALTVGSCSGCGGITPAGDLSGSSSSQAVVGIQSHTVAAPTTAAYLHWSGTAWEYSNPTGSGNVNGPSTSVSGNVATFNNTTGTLLQDSGVNFASNTLAGASGQHFTVSASHNLYLGSGSGGGGYNIYLQANNQTQLQGYGALVVPTGGNQSASNNPWFAVADLGGYNKSNNGGAGTTQQWMVLKPIIARNQYGSRNRPAHQSNGNKRGQRSAVAY